MWWKHRNALGMAAYPNEVHEMGTNVERIAWGTVAAIRAREKEWVTQKVSRLPGKEKTG